MQQNEPGFGTAFEQLHRTPDDHQAVSAAFARATGGSPVWAGVGASLANKPEQTAELLGFTAEAGATHASNQEALELFNHHYREIHDAMTAYLKSNRKNVSALQHVADHANEVFVHHSASPLIGKAAIASHMTDDELKSHQTGIEASAFATPEMVGAWYNPFKSKKKSSSSSSSSSSDTSGATKEKKPNVFQRTWRGAKKRLGGASASAKKASQRRQDASAQARAQKIVQNIDVDSKLDILKNSRGNSANQVYAVPGQIRRLTGQAPDDVNQNLEKLFGPLAAWRLPAETGFEGVTELGPGFSISAAIGVEEDFSNMAKNGQTWARVSAPTMPADYLGFGSSGRLSHPRAQLFLWPFGEASRPRFLWKSSEQIKIQAAFSQDTEAFGEIKRFDFAAVTQASSSFSYLGSTTRSKFLGEDIGNMQGYADFEQDLDNLVSKSVKVEGRKDPVAMLGGKPSEAYNMWKDGQLFVIDLTQNLLQRSAALTPRFRLYCKLKNVPKSFSSATALEVEILVASLEIQVQSIALGYSVVQHYRKEYPNRQAEIRRAQEAAFAAGSSAETGVVDG